MYNDFDEIELEDFGKLKIEKIILEANYPVLFTSKNEFGEVFLCACFYNVALTKKLLISKVTPEIIIKMLKDEITIGEAFVELNDKRVRLEFNGERMSSFYDERDWDIENSDVLPAKGEYMETEENEFDEEISFYESKKYKNYTSNMVSEELFKIKFPNDRNSIYKEYNLNKTYSTFDLIINVKQDLYCLNRISEVAA